MADAVTATKKKYMNFKEIAAYSLGLFGFQAIVGLLNSYQAEFDGSILGANVSVVAILILVAKIVSAVADPVVGNLIDRSKSKRGKFKSMILYSLVPLLVMTAVVFVKVPFSGTGLYVWIFLTYLVHCHDHGRCALAGDRFRADPGSHGAHQCGVHLQYL